VHFWRCCGATKVVWPPLLSILRCMNPVIGVSSSLLLQVWYEWALMAPSPSPIHNSNGRSYWVGLWAEKSDHSIFCLGFWERRKGILVFSAHPTTWMNQEAHLGTWMWDFTCCNSQEVGL
jgi:hypothetical protein